MMTVPFFVWVDYLIIADLLFSRIPILSKHFFDINKHNEIQTDNCTEEFIVKIRSKKFQFCQHQDVFKKEALENEEI